MPTLFEPIVLGDLPLPNRIVMAPLPRNRSSGAGRGPNASMRDYDVPSASAGLIISEATSVTPQGVGYPHTPGIWSDEQSSAGVLLARTCTRPAGRSCCSSGMSGAFGCGLTRWRAAAA
jgi:2,4-dienoyl-CoA reductase-like NADH-dependent reductase (Old Yellow Enzyme family)